MKSFLEFISENRFLEKVHENPSKEQVHALIAKSPHHEVRFVIRKNNSLAIGDASRFTHQEIEPNFEDHHTSGIFFKDNGINRYLNFGEHHPKLDKLGLLRG